MEYKLEFLSGKGIVSVKNEGRLNFQKARQYSVEATKLAHLNSCNKYLIDHTSTKSERGIYKLHADGAALERFGFKSTDRIAIVMTSKREENSFIKNKSQEARWCSVKYFNDIKKAVSWLVRDEK